MYQHKKTMAVITGTATAAAMILIFCFSAENDDLSSETSGKILEVLCSIVHWLIRSADKQAAFDAFLEIYIRKLAHFTEFAILGLFSTMFYAVWQKNRIRLPLLPLPLGFVYACSDEWHHLIAYEESGRFEAYASLKPHPSP